MTPTFSRLTKQQRRIHLNRSLKACDCQAHMQKGICRHRIRVSWELHQLKKQQVAA